MYKVSVILFFLFVYGFIYPQSNTNLLLQLDAPTNSRVSVDTDLSNIQFGKPFSVKFTMPEEINKIVDIGTNIVALGDTDVAVTNLTDNIIDLSVTTYAVTPYPMPSLLITALDHEGNTNLFYTPSFEIPISNAIVSNTNLTFADIESVYFVWNHFWTILIVQLILLGVGIFFALYVIKRKEKPKKEVVVDPFEQVSSKLKKLKLQSLELTEDNYKEFFVDLSETVREFMSHTIIDQALELPTRELILEMKNQKLEEELQEMITSVLKNTDRAKYAKQIFSQDRINEVIDDGFKIIKLVQRKKQQENNNELRKS